MRSATFGVSDPQNVWFQTLKYDEDYDEDDDEDYEGSRFNFLRFFVAPFLMISAPISAPAQILESPPVASSVSADAKGGRWCCKAVCFLPPGAL